MKKLSWSNAAFLLLLLTGWAAPAFPQMDIVVSPIRVEQKVAPGGSETDVIQVRNEGKRPSRVKVYLEDWQLDRKGDIIFARAGKNPQSCAAWVQVNPSDFRIEPGTTREVRYTLTVPPGAKPGSYWTALIVEGMPVLEGRPAARRMAVHGRIAVVLYETVGSPEIKAAFQDLQVKAGKKKLDFQLILNNSGPGNFRVKKSWIALKNSQGQEVARVEVPDIPVLPGTTRELEFSQDLALPPGNYTAEAVLDVGQRELLGKKQSFAVGR